MRGAYEERAARVPGATVWTRTVADATDAVAPVLPDGCMDLIWSEGRLFVAGPDTRAHPGGAGEGRRYAGIRFAPGTAPGYLGVPAHELRDTRAELADLWPGAEARRLTEPVAQPLVGGSCRRWDWRLGRSRNKVAVPEGA
ncbi:DUF6597 domain-containing transcriptional factor, partial [Streptomyces sp. NPDC006422]|uniref:DUF6597 domain-containing transcriptional factor n=1 Tax=Streptomyces sp. NPDC006422 TaxID=3155457 RepID=UPI0033B562A4